MIDGDEASRSVPVQKYLDSIRYFVLSLNDRRIYSYTSEGKGKIDNQAKERETDNENKLSPNIVLGSWFYFFCVYSCFVFFYLPWDPSRMQ